MNSGRLPWYQNWWRAVVELREIPPERREQVLLEIHAGSQPSAIYYVMLGVSSLIAGFAIIIDSDATLIGANVVAPLMTPIIGLSLGLLRGDIKLLGMAIRAEFGGALFGVILCFGLGLLPIVGEPSATLLAQTRPTLIDLFVAALAGLAGVLAMIDERISPALPGVAIATALNPPIAALGLCLASGAYAGAWGAFLLFFANVLAILMVGAGVFWVAGFVSRSEIGSLKGLARRFSYALISLLLVGIMLTVYLVQLVESLRVERTIKTVLDEQLAQEPNTALINVQFSQGRNTVDVIASVNAPRIISPDRVKQMQESLEGQLGDKVQLFVRNALTKDVTATGSTNIRPYLSLDGKITPAPLSPTGQMLQQAEQVTREVMANLPYMRFDEIQLVELSSRPVLLISIQSPRPITADQVSLFQARLQERLGEPDLRVDVRRTNTIDLSAKGPILLGEAHFGIATEAETQLRIKAEALLRKQIESHGDFFVIALDALLRDGAWDARADVAGSRLLRPQEIRAVEEQAAAKLGAPVRLLVLSRTELQVGSDGYQALGAQPEVR